MPWINTIAGPLPASRQASLRSSMTVCQIPGIDINEDPSTSSRPRKDRDRFRQRAECGEVIPPGHIQRRCLDACSTQVFARVRCLAVEFVVFETTEGDDRWAAVRGGRNIGLSPGTSSGCRRTASFNGVRRIGSRS